MKALVCQVCGDIIAPLAQPRQPRWCRCQTHAVWWEDPARGDIRLFQQFGPKHESGVPVMPRAFVLGLHNGFLYGGQTTRQLIEEVLADTPDDYVFRQIGHLAAMIRPGSTRDTRWAAELPEIVLDPGRPVPHHGSGPDNQ